MTIKIIQNYKIFFHKSMFKDFLKEISESRYCEITFTVKSFTISIREHIFATEYHTYMYILAETEKQQKTAYIHSNLNCTE